MGAARRERLPLPRWIAILAGLVGLLVAAFALSTVPGVRSGDGVSALWDVWIYDAVSAGAVAVCLARAIAVRAERPAWLLIGAALACAAAGDLVWTVFMAGLDEVPYPSAADAGWLAFYPFAYAGLMLLVRSRVQQLNASMWLDGLVAGLTTAALVAAAAFDTIVADTGGDRMTVATTLAYPVGDLLLMILVVGVFGVMGWRPGRSWALLGLGLLAWGLADTVYLYQAAAGTYVEGRPLDLLWPLGMWLVALAALQPTPARTARIHDWAALLIPSTASLLAASVLVAEALEGSHDVSVGLAGGAMLAGVARTALTFHEIRRLADSRHQALTDELTRLPNRRALFRRIDDDMADGHDLALIIFDLDGFKELNDALGHPTGDALLARIGPRLADALRPGDLLARLGGDEFAVVLAGVTSAEAARGAATRLREALERPFDLPVPAHVDASFGIALYPLHGRDSTELLQRADVAMYHAKRSRTAIELYDPERDGSSRDRLALIGELRGALDRGELVLHYQPQVEPASGALMAVEGLVRWEHPERGTLAPGAFIPAVEQTHLMQALTDHLVDAALTTRAAWAEAGLDVPVAINLAPANLLDPELPARVAGMLAAHGAEPGVLRLEITETAIMADLARATAVLGELRDVGVGLSLDDFGVGQSSLAILKHLPVDELKLDRAFGQNMVDDLRDAAIVKAALDLGRAFGLSVVAEGVEAPATLAALRVAGCPVAQGFAIARPMPADELVAWALGAAATAAAG
jgi:diguanylate cyclase (GGDEF)-like protein